MCSRCEELEERVAWLEDELGIQKKADIYKRLKASLAGSTVRGQVAELLSALYAAAGRPMSIWQILEAVPSPTNKEDRQPQLVSVWVCAARRVLGDRAIVTVWGRGYALSEAGMTAVADMLELKPADADLAGGTGRIAA